MSSPCPINLGAEDWLHPDWRGNFYPDGLPDDWLLSYYNTRFQAVYLPAVRWQAASVSEWSQWLDDTQPGFRFLLEPGLASFPCDARVIEATSDWSAEHVWWIDTSPDLRELAEHAKARAARHEPFFVISRSGDLVRLEQVAILSRVLGY
ncbi:MAG: hypothetical protein B7Z35_10200 [Hydrogenophilales bacterium 12-61-10]|nr:MAG: hypothetical protein B7Z35_10200 [Hydrogenophilales bacterium 12-61-10]OYX27334.1 MAG: hypothetical protein B7Z03_13880 [Hydrogenophilales bacterium 32-62-9]